MQQDFINTVKKALGRTRGLAPSTDLFTTSPSEKEQRILEKIRNRPAAEQQELVARLQEVTGPLHVDLHETPSLEETAMAIGRLVREKTPEWGTEKHVCRWNHPLINQLKLECLAELQGIPIHTAPTVDRADSGQPIPKSLKQQFRHQVEQSFLGITTADYCVAATATLALRSRAGQSRSVSLVPSIHVAVLEEKKLLATLEELYTLLKWDPVERKEGLTNNLSLISGPSKTADIELIMVHGAHGPRELHLFLIRPPQ